MQVHDQSRSKCRERGFALFFAIFALLLLSAIAVSLVFMANTETTVNANYREEQVAYFAAKAGIEEARARMMASDPHSIALPITAPTAAGGVIYLVNNGGVANAVQPWLATNAYADDELCHDGYGLAGLTASAPGIRCTAEPTSLTYYTTVGSALPFSGTANALRFKWVRIAPKLNGTLQGPGLTVTNTTYSVNSGVGTASTLVCWDGVKELVLTVANCNAMSNANATYMTNVYILTSLGVSPAGARKVVQAEVALNPTNPFPYGLFADSTACPAMTFTGNMSDDSYTTAAGGTYASTHVNSGADAGSNGGVTMSGNATVNGIVGVQRPSPVGPCASPLQTSGSASPTVPTYLTQPAVFPAPPIPSTPNSSYSPPSCVSGGGQCMVPGTYGNISLSGQTTLTITPGTYYINSLSMSGQSQISVSPAGAVVFNIGGNGQSKALDLSGQGIINDIIPNDFLINYGGTDTITLSGQGNTTAILNAPLSPVTLTGQGAWFGAVLGSTLTITGNGAFHFDRSAGLALPNNGYYSMIGYRELSY